MYNFGIMFQEGARSCAAGSPSSYLRKSSRFISGSVVPWIMRLDITSPRHILFPVSFTMIPETGLYDGTEIETCAILTTESNELVGAIHDRMPVVLHSDNYGRWLDPGAPPESLEGFLIPYLAELMATREVSNLVNNARCNAPECVQQVN